MSGHGVGGRSAPTVDGAASGDDAAARISDRARSVDIRWTACRVLARRELESQVPVCPSGPADKRQRSLQVSRDQICLETRISVSVPDSVLRPNVWARF